MLINIMTYSRVLVYQLIFLNQKNSTKSAVREWHLVAVLPRKSTERRFAKRSSNLRGSVRQRNIKIMLSTCTAIELREISNPMLCFELEVVLTWTI